jgi:hypothetical protein
LPSGSDHNHRLGPQFEDSLFEMGWQ